MKQNLMDADNRVVINCGGIRHEVYKVSIIHKIDLSNPASKIVFSPYLHFCQAWVLVSVHGPGQIKKT